MIEVAESHFDAAHAVRPTRSIGVKSCTPKLAPVKVITVARLHVPVKPLRVTEKSDVNVTMRKPVAEV